MADSESVGSGQVQRGHWGSRIGFILAASGSAIGLGNIWKFPYITGENGGGLFVLFYLACVVIIGLPIMMSEIIVGRRAQRSPVGAFERLRGERTAWRMVGWIGVVAGFIILSYYSVVAGWAMNYALMSIVHAFDDKSPDEISAMFGTLQKAGGINLFWHAAFMLAAIGVVIGGVQKGIEAWSRILMPVLFVMLVILATSATFQSGFAEAMSFVFEPNVDKFTAKGSLEALGHSFFTLSLGMGALITYGSYLRRDDDIVKASVAICVLDTIIALMACICIFPVIFSFGLAPEGGPGLVFSTLPIAFSQMTGGSLLAIIFFVLLVFAALTSAMSLLEVVASTVIDQFGWSRKKAVLVTGGLIFLFGVPTALSGVPWFSDNWVALFGMDFFGTFAELSANWLLPLGGLFIAIFVGWILPTEDARDEFQTGSSWGGLFSIWYASIRYVVPVGVAMVFLYSVGLIPEDWLK